MRDLTKSFITIFKNTKRIFLFLKQVPSIQNQADAVTLSLKDLTSVQFNSVTYTYPSQLTVLQGISFKCQAGKITAIVGKTSARKSTIFKLILREIESDYRSVIINKQDVHTMTMDSLRKYIRVVPQHFNPLNKTIYNNLLFAAPESTQKEIKETCMRVNLHRWIQSLPKKYETHISKKGLQLSGRQCQLLSIAQAILKNSKIIILDEPTSSVDNKTGQLIQRLVKELKSEGKTIIIITHHLDIAAEADKIIVLNKTKTLEQGTHNELMNRDGYYHKVWNVQHPLPAPGAESKALHADSKAWSQSL